MSMRLAIALVSLALAACSNLGFGKVVPGAGTRFRAGRQFAVQDLGGGWYRMGALGGAAEEVGGGRFGVIAGGRLGFGNVHVGDAPPLHAGGFDVRLETMFELMPWLGVGASGGWGLESAGDDMTTKVTASGWKLAALATLTPYKPFVLRAGFLAEPGTVSIDDVETKGTRKGVEGAAGITVAFRGYHYVILVDWRHLGGVADVSSDMYLLDAWVAF